MPLTSHAYTNLDDLNRMKAVLRANKQANTRSGYHIGDLNWWAFYEPGTIPVTEKGRLWFDGAELVGWTWTNWENEVCDIVIHHSYYGSAQEAEVLTQTINALNAYVLKQPQNDSAPPPQISAIIYADCTAQCSVMEALGFSGKDYLIFLTQNLPRELPPAFSSLPDGYRFLDQMQPKYVAQRADVHRAAFTQSKMTGAHYRQFMTAPDYDPELDVVLVAPDDRFAAFAMTWYDPTLKLGGFEPVGTRAELQRRGLGKAVQVEALRRLTAHGATSAQVITGAEQPENIAFYKSVGFEASNILRIYQKAALG